MPDDEKVVLWNTDWHPTQIKRVEAAKVTEHTALIEERWKDGAVNRRVNLHSGYSRYHRSFAEARTFLLGRAERRLKNAEADVEAYRRDVEAAMKLEEPKGDDA